jgi:hypothetical protein
MHDSTLTPAPPTSARPTFSATGDGRFVACLIGEHLMLGTTTPTLSVSSVSSCMQTECVSIAHMHGCHDAHDMMHAADGRARSREAAEAPLASDLLRCTPTAVNALLPSISNRLRRLHPIARCSSMQAGVSRALSRSFDPAFSADEVALWLKQKW